MASDLSKRVCLVPWSHIAKGKYYRLHGTTAIVPHTSRAQMLKLCKENGKNRLKHRAESTIIAELRLRTLARPVEPSFTQIMGVFGHIRPFDSVLVLPRSG